MIEEMIVEQAEGLMEGGADFILFETQPNRVALERLCGGDAPPGRRALRAFLRHRPAGETASGESVERMLAPLPTGSAPPIAWGMNCGVGPDGLLGAVERAVRLTALPLVVQPNAGHPQEVENRRIYLCSPEYLASYAKRYVALGASAVGGCCGTTPDHIREVALAVKPLERAQVLPAVRRRRALSRRRPPRWPRNRSSAPGWPAVSGSPRVELLPPRGYDLRSTVEKAKALHQTGHRRDQHPRRPPGQCPALAR